MAANLTAQVRNTAEVATAIAQGDLSRKITVDVKGEFLPTTQGNYQHHVVDQSSTFSEVTRVAREVGTKASSVARPMSRMSLAPGKDLTEEFVNSMAANLTAQVRYCWCCYCCD